MVFMCGGCYAFDVSRNTFYKQIFTLYIRKNKKEGLISQAFYLLHFGIIVNGTFTAYEFWSDSRGGKMCFAYFINAQPYGNRNRL